MEVLVSGAAKSTMDKVTYSSDTTVAVPGANLSVERKEFTATGARDNSLPTAIPFSNAL